MLKWIPSVRARTSIALGVLVAGLGACGGGSDSGLPVEKVARRLPAIRGLHFRRVPEVELVSRAESEKIALRDVAREVARLSPSDRARYRRARAEARLVPALAIVLGLAPARYSTRDIGRFVELAGSYDELGNRVYLIKDQVERDDVAAQSVLSHELTHALDTQAVGPESYPLASPFSEARDAERALREGSATITQIRYGIRYLGLVGSVSQRLRSLPGPPPGNRLERLATKELDFFYRQGARFVQALYRRGGWRLVNRALREPPTTSAEILQPRRWFKNEHPRSPRGDPGAALGPAWTRLIAGEFGAFATDELFFQTGPRAAVDRMVDDWEGSRVQLWQRRGTRLDPRAPDRRAITAVVQWRWRRAVATAAARAAVGAYLVRTFRATAVGVDTWRWRNGAAAFATAGTVGALVLAPSPALARAAARASARE